MSEDDLKIFLKAKKEEFASQVLTVLSLIPLCVIIVTEALAIHFEYTMLAAVFSSILLVASAGNKRWVTVTRRDLINLIERQINSDSEALTLRAKLAKN
ncbi:hypothetical protein NBRC116494_29040 [Aurantivibrio plasticivorans]